MNKVITALITVVVLALMAWGYTDASHHSHDGEAKMPAVKEIIFEHLGDAYGWEIPFSHSKRIPLPVIVRGNDGAWHVFSSGRITGGDTFEGFKLAHGGDYNNKVVEVLSDGSEVRPLDLSVTKNACGIFI